MSRERMAHIEEVVSVGPIAGADNIEVVGVLGWQCVAKKGDFKVGDKCVYIEIDSICPPTEMFQFLEPRKFRVKTIKLRKQISQGLALPIDEAVLALLKKDLHSLKVGDDVTEAMNIDKFQSKSDLEGTRTVNGLKSKMWPITQFLYRFAWFRWLYRIVYPKRTKGFPSWIKKSDEDRIQNNPTRYLGITDPVYRTEKLDGQSATYFVQKTKGLFGIFGKLDFGICSRNLRVGLFSNGSWPEVYKRLQFKDKLEVLYQHYVNLGFDCYGVMFQGEIIGPTIQKNKYHRTENEFYMFSAAWLDSKGKTTYFTMQEMVKIAKMLGLNTVPILDPEYKILPTLEEMLKMAEAKSVISKLPVEREGVVIRTHNQLVSFKVISNKFLLKYADEDEDDPAPEAK